MSRLNIPPTKSNQLRLSRELDTAQEGFRLLDQKREILVMELMRLLDRARRLQRQLDEAKDASYTILKKAITRNGYHVMRRVGSGINYAHRVDVRRRVSAGVRLPEITVTPVEFEVQYGILDTDSLVDETSNAFLELLGVIGQMAQLETSVWLLARELKKTQRRVNALEQIFIPDFQDTLQYIRETLESKELESFSILKMLKRRLENTEMTM